MQNIITYSQLDSKSKINYIKKCEIPLIGIIKLSDLQNIISNINDAILEISITQKKCIINKKSIKLENNLTFCKNKKLFMSKTELIKYLKKVTDTEYLYIGKRKNFYRLSFFKDGIIFDYFTDKYSKQNIKYDLKVDGSLEIKDKKYFIKMCKENSKEYPYILFKNNTVFITTGEKLLQFKSNINFPSLCVLKKEKFTDNILYDKKSNSLFMKEKKDNIIISENNINNYLQIYTIYSNLLNRNINKNSIELKVKVSEILNKINKLDKYKYKLKYNNKNNYIQLNGIDINIEEKIKITRRKKGLSLVGEYLTHNIIALLSCINDESVVFTINYNDKESLVLKTNNIIYSENQ